VASKTASIATLTLAEIGAMSPWFVSSAVLPEMNAEAAIPALNQALMASAVQAGFVLGAATLAIHGSADRFDPRWVFVLSALGAALANAALLGLAVGGGAAIAARFVTGIMMAGIYPVGMKIAVGWGLRDRGLLVGILVGALTLGSAAPHLVAFLGGEQGPIQWRTVVAITSGICALAGVCVLRCGLGPHHARAPRFDPRAIHIAWSDRRIRLAIAGYLGHMWELYAMWAWAGAAAATSFALDMDTGEATRLAKLVAFLAIGLGSIACVAAGVLADRIGKAEVTIIALSVSATAALASSASFGASPWLLATMLVIWGIAIVPDSAQFSALVADAAPAELAGSVLSLQTALGFTLTIVTVSVTPMLVDAFGWPAVLAVMAVGPAAGILAMLRLRGMS